MSPTERRVKDMPVWPECPWTLPDGVEARAEPDLCVLVNTVNNKFVGLNMKNFDPTNLPQMLERIA